MSQPGGSCACKVMTVPDPNRYEKYAPVRPRARNGCPASACLVRHRREEAVGGPQLDHNNSLFLLFMDTGSLFQSVGTIRGQSKSPTA